MSQHRIILALLVFTVLGGGAAHATIIDDFQVGPTTVTADSSDDNVLEAQTGLDTGHVLTGERSITVQGQMSVGSVEAEVDTSGDGTLTYRSNNPDFSNEFDGRLLLTYFPGDRFDTVDLGALLDGDTLALEVLSADFAGLGSRVNANLSISSPTDGIANVDFVLAPSATPYTLYFPLADLTPAGGDLSDIYNLTFDISRLPENATFTLGSVRSVSAIPTPSGLAMLAVLGGGLLMRRPRRRA